MPTVDERLKSYGATLLAARKKNNWTRHDLRQRTGLSESTIVRAERGDRVKLEMLMTLASALGVELPSDIRDFAVPPPPAAPMDDGPPEWFRQFMEQQATAFRELNDKLDALLREV